MAISGGQDELLQTEGTVILHITFALKQDQVCATIPDALPGALGISLRHYSPGQYTHQV